VRTGGLVLAVAVALAGPVAASKSDRGAHYACVHLNVILSNLPLLSDIRRDPKLLAPTLRTLRSSKVPGAEPIAKALERAGTDSDLYVATIDGFRWCNAHDIRTLP
jgi:hypothetical protein